MTNQDYSHITDELNKAKTLDELIFQALGAASMCWEDPGAAGIFDSERAKVIGEAVKNNLGKFAMTHTERMHKRSEGVKM